jgi:hypothetical protein
MSAGGHVPPKDSLDKTDLFCPHLGGESRGNWIPLEGCRFIDSLGRPRQSLPGRFFTQRKSPAGKAGPKIIFAEFSAHGDEHDERDDAHRDSGNGRRAHKHRFLRLAAVLSKTRGFPRNGAQCRLGFLHGHAKQITAQMIINSIPPIISTIPINSALRILRKLSFRPNYDSISGLKTQEEFAHPHRCRPKRRIFGKTLHIASRHRSA